VVGTPIALSETPVAPRSAPPTLGQHTDEVLRDWLGLDAGEVAAFHEQGIV
jgi:formyl-CoA transferase